MMTDDEIIAVVQAHKEGKPIQVRAKHSTGWHYQWFDCNESDWGSFGAFDYRVKPEPRKPREWWVRVTPDKQIISWDNREEFIDQILVREVIE